MQEFYKISSQDKDFSVKQHLKQQNIFIMKRLIFASLVMALFSGTTAFAQNNGGYVDDVYYNASQAEQDAKADAKKQKKQQQSQQENAEYYNSSAGSDNSNSYDGNAQVYNDYQNDDSYIDYDDDSYTTRIRRFNYPMMGMGYWGGVYSPFWNSPFYSNPYYGWGNWYTPGFSIGFGWGGGPYWNNNWGMNTWYGYGGFNSWYSPFGGYGGWGGYGGGYWNGYYAGLYDGGYGNGYNNGGYGRGRTSAYGPRGMRSGAVSVGGYGNRSRLEATGRNNMMQPVRGNMNNGNRDAFQTQERRNVSGRGEAIRLNSANAGNRGEAIRLNDNGNRNVEVNQNATRNNMEQSDRVQRRSGFFNRGNNVDQGSMQRSNNVERSQPSRNVNMEQRSSQPSRSYSPSSAPSRSFSSPAPSRSSGGGFGGGGGSRSGGGRR